MQVYKLYTSVDGRPGEFIEEWRGLDSNLVQFCYEWWPEYQAHRKACAAHKNGDPWPEPVLGRPPFEIQRADGSWHVWDVHEAYDADEDEDAKEAVVLNDSVSCQRCASHRVADAGGKCSDLGHFTMGSIDHDGYIPEGVGIGGDDYVSLTYCLDCGQIQGTFPLPISGIERGESE